MLLWNKERTTCHELIDEPEEVQAALCILGQQLILAEALAVWSWLAQNEQLKKMRVRTDVPLFEKSIVMMEMGMNATYLRSLVSYYITTRRH